MPDIPWYCIGSYKYYDFLGPYRKGTNIMTFLILTEKRHIISCSTVSRVTELEKRQDAHKEWMASFRKSIAEKFKKEWLATSGDKPDLKEWEDLLEEDDDFADEFNRIYNNPEVPEADEGF